MARNFTVLSADAFETLQLDAGVVLTAFDPSNPVTPTNETILATTTGGINVVCQPSYSDLAEDVDNAPNGLKEYMHLDGWDCNIGFTSLKFNPENTKWALGAADIQTNAGYTVVRPRRELSQDDFGDIYWAGNMANGGLAAVKLMNAISSAGLSIQTTKNGKGQSQQTITGHPSLMDQDVVPMEFYFIPPEGESTTVTVTQTLGDGVTSSITATTVDYGDSLSGTITEADTVVITMGGVDVTAEVYDSGTVGITAVTGDVAITASAEG